MKFRIDGREYEWAEHREDLFFPGATHSASRVIDFQALKMGLETFEADAVDACCQALEHEEVVVELAPECLERLTKAGRDTSCGDHGVSCHRETRSGLRAGWDASLEFL